MNKYLVLIFLLSVSLIVQTQNSMYTKSIDVTADISALQYMDIKLFVLKNGQVELYNDVSSAVSYSFQNVDIYLNPCNLDPMVSVDTIMPEQNYCEMVLKIKFDSDLYNSFFQYIDLKLIGDHVFLQPVYDDLEPSYVWKEEDILSIVHNIIEQIGTSYEYQ